MAVILIVVSWATKQSPGSIQNRFPRGSGLIASGSGIEKSGLLKSEAHSLVGDPYATEHELRAKRFA